MDRTTAHGLARTYAMLLTCLAIPGCGTQAQSALPKIEGTFAGDCAPYDGPAFIVRLPDPSGGKREIQLLANAPSAEAVGTWTHSDISAPMHAVVVVCATDTTPKCDFAKTGWFRVEKVSKGLMTGVLSATFNDGRRIHYAFAARAQANTPQQRRSCG